MAKKRRRVTDFHFNMGLIVIIIAIIILIYFITINNERFIVHDEPYSGTQIIPPDDYLSYKTEFCANKITQLIHEIHFLEKDMTLQKKILQGDEIISKEEGKIIEVEQREIKEVKQEIEEYKELCKQFDEQPTLQLCNQFLQEARRNFELAQKNAEVARNIIVWAKISMNNLRQAKRIYKELQYECAQLKNKD